MQSAMKLKAYIKRNDDGTYTARSEMHDGTQFKLKVREFDIQLNEEITEEMPEVTGFVLVQQLSLQDTRAYIELPGPTLEHGKNLTVHKYKLQPHGASINNFISPVSLAPAKNPLDKKRTPLAGKRYTDISPDA